MHTTALLGLLSGRQAFFATKMSQLVIRDKDQLSIEDSLNSDSDHNLHETEDEVKYKSTGMYSDRIAKSIILSKDKVE